MNHKDEKPLETIVGSCSQCGRDRVVYNYKETILAMPPTAQLFQHAVAWYHFYECAFCGNRWQVFASMNKPGWMLIDDEKFRHQQQVRRLRERNGRATRKRW